MCDLHCETVSVQTSSDAWGDVENSGELVGKHKARRRATTVSR
jgi:hypothetical protein